MTQPTPIAIIGAGKIGETIVDLLLETGDYSITLIDASAETLHQFKDHSLLKIYRLATDRPL